ncbi:MAG: Fe-S cluster assembly protein SufD [Duncaniella sp.]|nr:Fe-S cluster assembly protein SufD [Duncaniella sp.]
MNALKQYLDIYIGAAPALDDASAPVMNALRPAALDALRSARFPDKSDEGYEKTSVEDMMAPDYGINMIGINIPVDVARSFKCDVPAVSTLMGFILNDSFMPVKHLRDRLPKGVIFTSLRDAAITRPQLVEKYYGRLADLDNTPAALNTLLARDGAFIYIPRGVKVDRPLQLVDIFSAPSDIMGVRRVLIVLEEGAEASLLVCDHTQDAERNYLASQVMEIFLAPQSSLKMCMIEESGATTTRHAMTWVEQQQGSSLTLTSATLTAGTVRNEWNVALTGEGAECRLAGMAIGSRDMHIDNSSNVTHIARRCHSDQVFKYVLDDNASGAFEGTIVVSPGSQYTEAYQTNRNLLASTGARMHTRPQLEIYNDDVKCSHGAATGQLDTEALFYMRSRGIPEAEARTMLMQAFMLDVVDTVAVPGVADRLRHLVERRFAGADMCEGCAIGDGGKENSENV